MENLEEIVEYLNDTLEVRCFYDDYANNGLQVEGAERVKKIVFAVDASLELFNRSVEAGADMIVVHHGISWGNGFKYITGRIYRQLSVLIKNDISLYAVHLPLDADRSLGHNYMIAEMIGLENSYNFAEFADIDIGYAGVVDEVDIKELAENVAEKLDSSYKIYGPGGKVSKVGIISGGAGEKGILAAVNEGLDCLITGEFGHTSWHLVKELGISVIACGHYKTEIPGIKALQEALDTFFDIETEFIDIPTGL